MKTETEIRRFAQILQDAIDTGCPCQTIEDQEQCEKGRMLLEAAKDTLRFVLGENPRWEAHVRAMAQLTLFNRLHYGLRTTSDHGKER